MNENAYIEMEEKGRSEGYVFYWVILNAKRNKKDPNLNVYLKMLYGCEIEGDNLSINLYTNW